MSLISATQGNASSPKCTCRCHIDGYSTMTLSLPPQPCCQCLNTAISNMNKSFCEGLSNQIDKDLIKLSLPDIKELEKRIDCLENKNIDHQIKRIAELEAQVIAINKQKFSEFHHLKPNIEELEKKIIELRNNLSMEISQIRREEIENLKLQIKELERFQDITRAQYEKVMENSRIVPHKCPICYGQKVSLQHDSNGGALSTCHPCEGKGIVWG